MTSSVLRDLILESLTPSVNAPLVPSTWLIKWIDIEVDNWTKAHIRWGFRVQILRNQFGLIWSKLNPWVGPGFLLCILWCSQSGNHPENNLAKFCYILNMKLEIKIKIRILLYFWLPPGTYNNNLVIWLFFSFKIWRIRVIFYPWKTLCIGRSPNFQVEIWQKFATKRNSELDHAFNPSLHPGFFFFNFVM